MKKLILVGIICTVWMSRSANSQAYLSDPSYSVHNYKHPNKAAIAKEIQHKKPVVYLEEVKDQDEKENNNSTSGSNYKAMNSSRSKIKKFKVVSQPQSSPVYNTASNGNYKQQFAPRTKRK